MGLKLVLATQGPCAGHLCDNCRQCRSGVCCKRDHPDYRLPEAGSWDGVTYGDLGVLDDDGTTVGCHACGGRLQVLTNHLRAAHNLTVQEYRALFGLNATQPLASTAYRDQQRASNAERLALVRPEISTFALLTAEQRQAIAHHPRRLQDTHRDFGKGVRTRVAAHTDDPEKKEAWIAKLTATKRERGLARAIFITCVICGAAARVTPGQAAKGRATCSRACGAKLTGQQRISVQEKPCATCGKAMYLRPSEFKSYQTCSPPCRAAYLKTITVGRPPGESVQWSCPVCGQTRAVYPSEARRRRTCGTPACSRAWRATRAATRSTQHPLPRKETPMQSQELDAIEATAKAFGARAPDTVSPEAFKGACRDLQALVGEVRHQRKAAQTVATNLKAVKDKVTDTTAREAIAHSIGVLDGAQNR